MMMPSLIASGGHMFQLPDMLDTQPDLEGWGSHLRTMTGASVTQWSCCMCHAQGVENLNGREVVRVVRLDRASETIIDQLDRKVGP